MKIVNPPKHVPINDYEKAVDAYLEKIKKVPGVLSVYLMGGFGAPGLSDIDIIIVVEDNFNPNLSHLLSVKGINDYLFIHGPLVFPRMLAWRVQNIVYASDLKLIWGEKLLKHYEELDTEAQKILSKIYVVDFLESRFLQFSSVGLEVDKRAWLTRTWSTIHSVKLLENTKDFSVDDKICSLLFGIKFARSSWLENGSVQDVDFINAFKSAQELSFILFIRVLGSLYGDVSLGERKVKILEVQKKIIFSDESRFPEYRARQVKWLNRKLTFWNCRMPSAYLAHVNNYKKTNSYSWFTAPRRDDALVAVMHERFNCVREHVDWLQKHAINAYSMNGYLGINVSSKICAKNIFMKTLNRIIT